MPAPRFGCANPYLNAALRTYPPKCQSDRDAIVGEFGRGSLSTVKGVIQTLFEELPATIHIALPEHWIGVASVSARLGQYETNAGRVCLGAYSAESSLAQIIAVVPVPCRSNQFGLKRAQYSVASLIVT